MMMLIVDFVVSGVKVMVVGIGDVEFYFLVSLVML